MELGARFDQITSTISCQNQAAWNAAADWSNTPLPWQYNRINGTLSSATTGNAYPLRGTIPAFACPSDITSRVPDSDPTGTSYCMSLGDAAVVSTNNGSRGLFRPQFFNPMSNCIDGTSNTLAFSEAVVGVDANGSRFVKGNLALVATGLDTNPIINCSVGSVVSTTDRTVYASTISPIVRSGGTGTSFARGWKIADARSFMGTFHTILPPNSPSCKVSHGDGASTGVFSASSRHAGGVNVCVLDGSGRFISDTIDFTSGGAAFPIATP